MSWKQSWPRSRGSRTSCTGSIKPPSKPAPSAFHSSQIQFIRYVRELEQQNDDLERVKRSTLARWAFGEIFPWLNLAYCLPFPPQLGRFRGKNECCYREKCLPRVRARREGLLWQQGRLFNIFLQENLKMAVQRLKDETRDLRSELKVLNPQVVSGTDVYWWYWWS